MAPTTQERIAICAVPKNKAILANMTSLGAVLLGLLCFLPAKAVCCEAEAITIYVGQDGNDGNVGDINKPLRTIEEAQLRVRKIIADGLPDHVRVVIGAGVYELTEPLRFGPDDSPPNDRTITYMAAPGETVVVSGGRAIEDWSQDDRGCWQAKIPVAFSGGADSDTWDWRQLFVDDARATRARVPNQGFFRVRQAGTDKRTSLQFDLAQWRPNADLPGLELAILHDWSMSRVAVRDVNRSSGLMTLLHRVGATHGFFDIDGFEAHPRFFLENSLALLDAENEFYYDAENQTLHLKLPADQSPVPRRVVAPGLPSLIRIEGGPNRPVRQLRFVGLQFAHTTCPIPPTGYAGIQASFFERRGAALDSQTAPDYVTESGHARLPAAFEAVFAENCVIEQCQFRQLGGGGIYLDRQTNHIEIRNCKIDDIGACGVMIGEPKTRMAVDGTSLVCSGNVVRENSVSRCGQILLGSVGIWIGIARDTQVVGNEVFELPYSGISVGWRWDAKNSGCQQNQITGNHIHHVMQTLSDGAGIYTLGRQPGTVLKQNRIHDVPVNAGRAESNGIFMDEGSSEILVIDNVIYRIARSPIRFHKARVNTLRNNSLYLEPGVEAFTFNNTDPGAINMESNRLLSNEAAPPD